MFETLFNVLNSLVARTNGYWEATEYSTMPGPGDSSARKAPMILGGQIEAGINSCEGNKHCVQVLWMKR